MAVSVNMPGRREEKDPLDTILKGLGIASSIFGIKEASAKASMLAEQQKFDRSAKEAELASKGFEKKVGDDGSVSFLRPPGYQDLQEQKTRAEIAKLQADANRKGSGDPFADELKALRVAEMKGNAQKAAFAKTPEGRAQGLNSGDKQRLDNVRMAFQEVGNMASALPNNNTFSLIGDNDFTLARTKFEEALGRMQTGAAITKDEENRFKKMAPTAMDSAEMQQKKLAQLEAEFGARFGTLGFKPEDFGLSYRTSEAVPENEIASALRTPMANARPAQSGPATAEDAEAVKWALQNPNDPRSKAILKANGR